jgi:hypothetical protein
MKAVFVIAASFAVVCLGIDGVLMCVSPKRYYEFRRWLSNLSFGGPMVVDVPPGRHLDVRIAGFIFILGSVFFAYGLVRVLMSPGVTSEVHSTAGTYVIQIKGVWGYVVIGIVAILVGLYMFFRTEFVVRRFNSQGHPHSPDPAEHLRRTKIGGIAFILFGLCFLFNAIRTLFR